MPTTPEQDTNSDTLPGATRVSSASCFIASVDTLTFRMPATSGVHWKTHVLEMSAPNALYADARTATAVLFDGGNVTFDVHPPDARSHTSTRSTAPFATVTSAERLTPPPEAVTVSVPGDIAVNKPAPLMVPTVAFDTDHVSGALLPEIEETNCNV